MKTTKILAALCASAMVISAMAAQVSADETKAAETTAAAADESTTPAYVFSKGVWLLTSESGAGTYYIFDDEKGGHTERDDGTGGVPFSCEQDGWNITFHFGGPDDTTKAVCSEGDASITFTYEDGTTKTYTVSYMDGTDPDTFTVDESAAAYTFSKGVWAFTSVSGEDTYYIFYDENSGHTERADGTGGVPFSCEQDGLNITFHFGGPDDTTKAVCSEGDANITFTYDDGTTKIYTVSYIDGADPDTFDIDSYLSGIAGANVNLFSPGVWMYTVYPVDGYTVTDPQGYFRINEDGESGEWVDKAGFASKFEIDQSDLSDIRIKVDGEELDGMIQIEYESIDAIAAYISIAGNTMLYTFNHVPEDEEDAFIESFGSSSNGVVDAADSKGSPDTGVADVAAAAGLGILAAGAFIAAKKRK